MGKELRRVISWRRMESSSITNAVGVWFYSISTDRHLYLLRNDTKHPGTWGLPGGKVEAGESLLATINRECCEEIGHMPKITSLVPLEKFTSTDGAFSYHTFFATVVEEFTPVLNYEHIGYSWISRATWPKPMHPGLWSTVNFDVVQDKISRICQHIQTSQVVMNSL